MVAYHKRWLEKWILGAIEDEPVVIVSGARQVGKSTTLKNMFADWDYFTFDDFDTLAQAEKDPMPILSSNRAIIDEVQKVPKVLNAIKQIVDSSERQCRFVLSGSANLMLMQKVTESLAGRAVTCELGPFTLGERDNLPVKNTLDSLFDGKFPESGKSLLSDYKDLKNTILKGWIPLVILEKNNESALRWFDDYVRTYLERDLRQLSQIDSLSDFRRLMTALALRSGQLLNQTEVGRDISIPQPTVNRYINLLEASFLFERLPAYSVNRTKRLVKTPKPYFVDSGLAAFLAGFTEDNIDDKFFGSLFETAVLQHLQAWCQLKVPSAKVYYWRTVTGNEVDFVLEKGRDLVAIEVKATEKIKFSHADGLRVFMEEYPETKAGAVIYLGNEYKQLDEKIFAIPFCDIV